MSRMFHSTFHLSFFQASFYIYFQVFHMTGAEGAIEPRSVGIVVNPGSPTRPGPGHTSSESSTSTATGTSSGSSVSLASIVSSLPPWNRKKRPPVAGSRIRAFVGRCHLLFSTFPSHRDLLPHYLFSLPCFSCHHHAFVQPRGGMFQ